MTIPIFTNLTRAISREDFIEAVGREPAQDDLDRCNCNKVGEPGHLLCGWCEDHHNISVEIFPKLPDVFIELLYSKIGKQFLRKILNTSTLHAIASLIIAEIERGLATGELNFIKNEFKGEKHE